MSTRDTTTEDNADSEETTSGKEKWLYPAISIVATALVPIVISLGPLRNFLGAVEPVELIAVGVLIVLGFILAFTSARKRYEERLYLRLWKERQQEREAERRIEMREAERRWSRHDMYEFDAAEAAPGEGDGQEEMEMPREQRLLRQLGLEPAP